MGGPAESGGDQIPALPRRTDCSRGGGNWGKARLEAGTLFRRWQKDPEKGEQGPGQRMVRMSWLWESLQENREAAGKEKEAGNHLKVGNMNAGRLGQV